MSVINAVAVRTLLDAIDRAKFAHAEGNRFIREKKISEAETVLSIYSDAVHEIGCKWQLIDELLKRDNVTRAQNL